MDATSWGLLAFVSVAVAGAIVMLWPRFRDALSEEDPVAPSVLLRLQDALDTSPIAEAPIADELRRAVEQDVSAVRSTREEWRRRLRAEAGGPLPAVESALDDL